MSLSDPDIWLTVSDDEAGFIDPAFFPNRYAMFNLGGMTFPRCYSNFPLCSPSRTTFLTGMSAHNHHVTGNGGATGGWLGLSQYMNNSPYSLAYWLTARGYYVIHVGKLTNGFNVQANPLFIPPGYGSFCTIIGADETRYSDFELADNGLHEFYGPSDYTTDVFGQKLVTAIASAPPDMPLAIFYWPNAPHAPAIPPTRYANTFANTPFPHRLNFNESDATFLTKPYWTQIDQDTGLTRGFVNANNQQDAWQRRNGCVLAIDDTLLLIKNALIARGRWDVTYRFYISDNGKTLGEHRLVGKDNVYEESTFLVAWAAGPGITPGSLCSRLIGNVDFCATICDLSGATPGYTQDGRSMRPLFSNPNRNDWRTAIEIACIPDTGFYVQGLRGENWTFFNYNPNGNLGPGPQNEMYYMPSDVYQLYNKQGQAAYSIPQAALTSINERLRTCVGNQCWITDAIPDRPSLAMTLRTAGNPAFVPIDVQPPT